MIIQLVHNRLWTYTRLPIDGLKSVVFHGKSPTLCIGSGNVWIDHLDLSLHGCMTPKDALSTKHKNERDLDVDYFFSQSQIVGTCFRPNSH